MTTGPISMDERRARRLRERVGMADDFRESLLTELDLSTRVRFPSPHYQKDPVRFFREVLGLEPWSRQRDILEAVRDHDRVAVISGHKVGKSNTCAGLALWFYCSFADARVVMTSTTSRQVDQILWRELRMMRARAGRCVACKAEDPAGLFIPKPCPHSTVIDGEQGELARTGCKSADFREIVGFTAREAEAVAGISGRHLLYIVDEASGVPDEIFEAIEGNRAGGARIIMCSNGTRNEGEFFAAFNAKARFYRTLRVSSEETPNVVEGREVIPGLATREWVNEKAEEWGRESPLFRVRVLGQHATHEEGKVFSLAMISDAETRWYETQPAGRLYLGLDPAGASGLGDETAMCVRRGLKVLELVTMRGLNAQQHIVRCMDVLARHKLPRETPVVVLDRDGPIGAELATLMREYGERYRNSFELFPVRSGDKAVRRPDEYDRIRDELAANLLQWMRDGGAIVEDTKLERELHVFEWRQKISGQLQLTRKDVIKKLIGRSPDRYDALALSVWEPLLLTQRVAAPAAPPDTYTAAETTFDPYDGGDAWRAR